MEFIKRAFGGRSPARATSSTLPPNQTNPISPALDNKEKFDNFIVQVFPGRNAGKLPSCATSATSPVSSDPSQTIRDMLDGDRGLVLDVTEARKYAPSIGPVLTKVKSVKRSQSTLEVTTVQKQRACPKERAVAPRTGGVKLPRSESEMLRDKCEHKKLRVLSEPEKLREESRPKKLFDISLPVKTCLKPQPKKSRVLFEPEKLCDESQPEQLRDESQPKKLCDSFLAEKLCDKSQTLLPRVKMPASSIAVTTSDSTHQTDMSHAVNVLQEELASQQKKFLALYSHTTNLAHEIEKRNVIIDALQVSQEKAQALYEGHKSMTNSLLAFIEKDKKTKFISGPHKLSYHVTAPTKAVVIEMDKSAERIRKQHHLQQRDDVVRIVEIVDQLAKKYAPRYLDISTKLIVNPPESEEERDQCVKGVPNEFLGMWLHTIEPSVEEMVMYDKHMSLQLRPAPIYSPSFPTPRVQWSSLNSNYLKNMPKSQPFPIESCSLDPSFYHTITPTTELFDGRQFGLGRSYITDSTPLFEKVDPFGTMHGFMTDVGVLPVPEMPVHGYSCDPQTGDWVIAARGG